MTVWDCILYNMTAFLYILSLLFIWVEWRQYSKKQIVFTQEIENSNHLGLFLFSMSKILNTVSLFIGLLTPFCLHYLIIIFLELSKFVILVNFNSRIINIYTLLCSLIYTIIYLKIFIQGVVL